MKTIATTLALLLSAGAPLAAPAAAMQDRPPADAAPPAKGEDVVVVARRERDRQIRDFVRGMTQTRTEDPLARFAGDRLCPYVFGLTPEFDRAVVDRMRRVATAAKIPLARDNCGPPNALVLFVDDKAATLKMLHAKFPEMFVNDRNDDVTVRKEDGPAVAWHVSGLVDIDGARITASSGFQSSTITPPSRIVAGAHPIYVFGVVLIELRALVGLSTRQIADYAAMRVFTDADPAQARASGAPTVLTVLDAGDAAAKPPSLTEWDLGFVRGLYAVSPDYFAGPQRGQIGRYMKQEIEKAGTGGK